MMIFLFQEVYFQVPAVHFHGEYRIPEAQGIPATCTSTAAGNGTGKSSAVARPANLAATWQLLVVVVVVWGEQRPNWKRSGSLDQKRRQTFYHS